MLFLLVSAGFMVVEALGYTWVVVVALSAMNDEVNAVVFNLFH